MNNHLPRTYKQAFTIVELLIVIVVIGILAAISIVAYNGVLNRANAAATNTDLLNLEKKLKTYHIEHGTLPGSVQAMAADGFAATDKMNQGGWTPRGQYVVNTTINSGVLVYFWDYTAGRWMIQHYALVDTDWEVGRGTSATLWDHQMVNFFIEEDCTTELLEECEIGEMRAG